VRVGEVPPADLRPLLTRDRADLVKLLRDLPADRWTRPTAVPGWRIKDIALHLLDDDLGWLSRGRDRDPSGLLDSMGDERAFVDALAAKNQRWVDGAAGLSQRVVCDLLQWSGLGIDQFLVTADLTAPARVSWASHDPVPQWLDISREFTERWVHQHQIRDAVEQPDNHLEQYVDAVLDTFVWAFPHQYRLEAEPGTQVELALGGHGRWHLTRQATGWDLGIGGCPNPEARVTMSSDAAWRVLTGAPYDTTQVTRHGRRDLTDGILAVRAIII
jgi:uncharacterized protein (TIGR03083 family)